MDDLKGKVVAVDAMGLLHGYDESSGQHDLDKCLQESPKINLVHSCTFDIMP